MAESTCTTSVCQDRADRTPERTDVDVSAARANQSLDSDQALSRALDGTLKAKESRAGPSANWRARTRW
jgi:hypothetical protein